MDITNTNNLVWEDGMSDLRDIATLCKEIDYLMEQVDTLRKERDEARREVCNWSVGVGIKATSQEVAEKRGWDCYKEAK